jgi:hypothetical protein
MERWFAGQGGTGVAVFLDLPSADKAQLSPYALFLTSSFPRRLRIQKRTFRRNAPPFFDWQPFGWRKRTGFRLSPE